MSEHQTPEEIKAASDRALKAQTAALHDAYLTIFQSPNGKIVLTDIERSFSLDGPAPSDPQGMAIFEGMRRVLIHIRRRLIDATDTLQKPETKTTVIKA